MKKGKQIPQLLREAQMAIDDAHSAVVDAECYPSLASRLHSIYMEIDAALNQLPDNSCTPCAS